MKELQKNIKKDKRMMAIEADVARMLDQSKKYQRETHSEVIRRLLNKQKGGDLDAVRE